MMFTNVISWGRAGEAISVTMEYLPTLSVNRYKTVRGITRREVQQWMDDLGWVLKFEVKHLGIEPPIKVRVDGFFKDNRSVPDLHNLHKVIGDAIENGIGINDRHLKFEDGEIVVGDPKPKLKITLTPIYPETVGTPLTN